MFCAVPAFCICHLPGAESPGCPFALRNFTPQKESGSLKGQVCQKPGFP